MSTMLKTVVIITGIVVLLNLGGIETNSGGLVKGFLNGGLATFANSTFWSDLISILTLGAGTAFVASLFARSPSVEWATALLVSSFGGLFLFDLIGLYNTLNVLGGVSGSDSYWITGVASAIFIPLAVGYFIVFLNFWRGND